MSKPAESVKREVNRLIEPIIDEMGFELVNVEYLSEYGRWVLRVYVDEEGGITLDDCARVSREIGNLIDVQDIVPHEYVLEVSSPGIGRPLKLKRQYINNIGRKLELKLKEGKPQSGMLSAVEEDTITILKEVKQKGGKKKAKASEEVQIPFEEIKKAVVVVSFKGPKT